MKKACTCLTAILICFFAVAQKQAPAISIKWAPTGLAFGSLSLQGEYNFDSKRSLTAKIGLPVNVKQSFSYEDQNAGFDVKTTSFLAGYRMYLSKKNLSGLYFEPFFEYVHLSAEGKGSGTLDNKPAIFDFTNQYNAAGVGAQLGAQFLISNKFVIDFFFLGPQVNSARNNFKAVERTSTIPWTSVQADEAESDIREFLDQFPFIRNKTQVMVDEKNRLVSASFKGALPFLRAGVSIGFVF